MQRILPSSNLKRIVKKEGQRYLQFNDGSLFLVKSYGEIVNHLRPFSIVCGGDLRWGAVDCEDMLVIPCKYNSLSIDEDGHIIVKLLSYYKAGSGYFFSETCEPFEIDHLGNPILRLNNNGREKIVSFWGADAIYNHFDLCVIYRRNNKEGLAKLNGEIILEPLFDSIRSTGNARGTFEGYCVGKGIIYIECRSFSDGLVAAYITQTGKSVYHFLNRKGESILILDDKWKEKNLIKHIGWVEHGFHNGRAELRTASRDCDYYEEAYEIDLKGDLIRRWYADGHEIPDARDYLDQEGADMWGLKDGGIDEYDSQYREAFDDDPGSEWNFD